MSRAKRGICAICGKEIELTFEHIPPKSAFNNRPAKPITSEELLRADQEEDKVPWDTEGLRYINLQKGMGGYYLCQECNNNTGSWYGKDYTIFAKSIGKWLQNSDVLTGNTYLVEIGEIYPLRIIKQAVSMICSINQHLRMTGDKRITELAEFVQNKDKTHLDNSMFQVLMYATKSELMKFNPMTAIISDGVTLISEVVAFPLGFAVNFTPERILTTGIDITGFSEYSYDDKSSFQIPLSVVETNIEFPYDFRSKEEILRTREINKKYNEIHTL